MCGPGAPWTPPQGGCPTLPPLGGCCVTVHDPSPAHAGGSCLPCQGVSPTGPALQLDFLWVVRRIDVVTNTDTFVTCINVRVEVTLIALLSLLKGLYDGCNLLSSLGHELTLTR